MKRPATALAMRIMAALGLAVAACGCSGTVESGGNVTILVSWGGREYTAFRSVIGQFEALNPGLEVHVEQTRALTYELGADLEDGDPPDVAALPSIGAISQYAKQGELQPLDGLVHVADYGAPWSALMQGPGHHEYAVPVKADVKSLFWYDPRVFARDGYSVPQNWSQLLTLSASMQRAHRTPWCLAVSSASTSGWPGTDWIADILLSKYGSNVYQKWVSGGPFWKSSQVKQAWAFWGQLLGDGHAVYGGLAAALLMHVESVNPTSVNPPEAGCYLSHGTLVDEGFSSPNKKGKSPPRFPTDYNFFSLPPSGAGAPIQVSADFIGMFNGTASARKLIQYLASARAQQLWVHQAGADGFSVDKKVQVLAYPDPATRLIARLLASGKHQLCFGAPDAMSPDLSAAFDHEILKYLTDPGSLPAILTDLSRVPPDSGNPPSVCSPAMTTSGRRS